MHNIEKPVLPFVTPIYEKLKPGCKIIIVGHIPHHFDEEFIIELLSGPFIVIHLKFQFHVFSKNLLIINSCANGQWAEQVEAPNPLHKGKNFEIVITVHKQHYSITADGHDILNFPHRFPFETVQALGVRGNVEIKEIKFDNFTFERVWDGVFDWGHKGYDDYGTTSYQAPDIDQSFPHYDAFQ